MIHLFLIAALGGFSATGFAPLSLWPLTIFAFAALLHAVRQAPTQRRALAIGWWFGLGQFAIGLNWIATAFTYQAKMPIWLGWVAVLLLSLYLAIYPAVAAGLAWRWGRRRLGAFVLAFAAAWIVAEWLRAGLFTGFAWNPLSVTVVALPVAGLSALVGTYGLSGVIVLIAGAVLWCVETRGLRALLAVPIVAALAIDPRGPPPPATGALVRIVQPNIGQHEKNRPGFELETVRRLARGSGRPPGGEPRLLLWPEAATPYYLEEQPEARRAFAKLLAPRDILLTGGTAFVFDRWGEPVAARNGLFVMDARARLRGRYDKAHLVPFGEYLPMRGLLSAIGISRLVPGAYDFLAGPGARTLDVPLFGRVGVQICYEIIFSGHVADRIHRPDFIFNPSNDAWFGKWGPPQHLAQARLRAIEEGLPVLRATPTGISAVVDADGRVLAALPWREAGRIDARLPAAHGPTPFARLGNILSLMLAALLALATMVVRRRAPR